MVEATTTAAIQPKPDLAALARIQDLDAFEVLLDRVLAPALRLARIMVGDEADDVVQEAALKAWRRLAAFRGDEIAWRPWFRKIVVNQCRQAGRSRWRSLIRLPSIRDADTVIDDFAAERVDLARALRALPANQRAPLYLHFLLDLPLQEVATVLGISLSLAKARVYRGLRRLKPLLTVDPEEAI